MREIRGDALRKVLESFSLESLQKPVDLVGLAKSWGVTSIETQTMDSEAMLLPGIDGYKIVLKDVSEHFAVTRQRFSFAHEIGHLLLQLSGFQKQSNLATKHRAINGQNQEERLCDQIAAEILMPRRAFENDLQIEGQSLEILKTLAGRYRTSIPATAQRMVALMSETSVMAIWKPAVNHNGLHKLQQSYARSSRYGVPNSSRLPLHRLWMIRRTTNSRGVESGIAPIVDKRRRTAAPPDAPVEAWAWGQGEYRRVMMYYYPKRELTDDMVALSKATWRVY